MYHIAICDDDEQQRILVKSMLTELSIVSDIEFDTTLFSSGEELFSFYLNEKPSFHLIILDIEMLNTNGIDTAKKIRALGYVDEQIIFLTSYPQYMVESFDVLTFQYLLKPVDPSVFKEKIIKLHNLLHAQKNKFLVIKTPDGEQMLKTKDILYIEVAKNITIKNKIYVVTETESYESRGLISEYAAKLEMENFLQIHRSIIINLSNVRRFTASSVIMSNDVELPIGRSKIKQVKDTYTKFMITRIQ